MRSFVLGLVATVVVLAAPSPVLARAELQSSDPTSGASLSTLPKTVSITLSDPVGRDPVLRVLDSSGTQVDDGEVTVAGRRVLVDVRPATDTGPVAGAYRIIYRVVSADGHPVTGEVPFSVKPSSNGAKAQPSASTGSTPDDVTVTDVKDDPSQKWAPLWVMGFLVISSALLVYIVKVGLTSSSHEDDD